MDDLLKINNDIYTFLEKALSDGDLLKYLYYTDGSPLKNKPVENTIDLINTNIFVDLKIVNVQDVTKTFMIFYPDNFELSNDGYIMNGDLVFDIITHTSLTTLDDGSKRVFCIANKINNIYHKQYIGGIGRCYLRRFVKLIYNNDYHGYRFIYKIVHDSFR